MPLRRIADLPRYCLFLLSFAAGSQLTAMAPAHAGGQPNSASLPGSGDYGVYNDGPTIEVGTASWYGGKKNQGRRTASGERFNQDALTAAHPTLPFSTRVKVTNLENGLSVIVRITDRNATYTGRVIDLSRKAAEKIGLLRPGIASVAVVPIEDVGPLTRQRAAVNRY